MKSIKFILLFLLLTSGVCSAGTIDSISVKGNKRVQSETILSYLSLKEGDELSAKKLSSSLKSLYATDLFADVIINEDNNGVVITVLENPIINVLSFEGNVRIREEILQSEVSLRSRLVYTKTRVQHDLERIKTIYEKSGYLSATVNPKIIALDENRVNLIFEIKEGYRAKIKNINIIGNKNYSDDLLKNKLATSESRWYKFLSGNQSFDEDRLAYDRELLKRFYLSRGYVDFHVLSVSSKLSKNKKEFYITFKVEEGDRYKISDVTVNALLRDIDKTELDKIVNYYTKKDAWYNVSRLEKAILDLTKEVENMQYAFVKISPEVNKNEEDKTVSISYNIGEGQKVFVNNINVSGNSRTKDSVIRREFELIEGDAFNRDKLVRSERDLRNLNYFDNVDIDIVEKDDGITDIDVSVSEKSTGAISMGVGFSTDDGLVTDFSISESNFLGNGQKVKLGTVISGDASQIDFSFIEPYFLGRDLEAGIDIFNIERDYQDESSYSKDLAGFALKLGYPLTPDLRQSLTYKFENKEIFDVGDDASSFIKAQAGEERVSSISNNLIYDTRDSALDPTEGTLLTMTNELAGLGGVNFVKNILGGGFYYPLGEQVILSNYAEAGNVFGYSDDEVGITERFFIGGRTLRGFEKSGVGPRDIDTGDAIGGENYIKNSLEISYPLGLSKDLGVRGYSFFDMGTLWGVPDTTSNVYDDASIRSALGFGISWKSPMGPLRINFAYPLTKEEYDKDEIFSFTFGTRF